MDLLRVKRWLAKNAETFNEWSQVILPAALLLFSAFLQREDFPAVRAMRHKVFDLYLEKWPRTYQDVPVRVVDLDDASLARLGQWPWPRTLVAKLVRTLSQGSAVIAFDIVFAEPDRTSPAKYASELPQTPEFRFFREQLHRLPDNDKILEKTIREVREAGTGVVTAFVLTGESNKVEPARKTSITVHGPDPMPFLAQWSGAVDTLPGFVDAAAGNGSFNSSADSDGIIRRYPLVVRQGDRLLPTLAAEAIRVLQGGEGGYIVKTSGASGEEGEDIGITKIKINQIVVPTDQEGMIRVHYAKYAPGRFIPAWKVLERDFDPATLGGGIVFFGTSAQGLKDLRATPLDPMAPGVVVHAEAAEQMLLNQMGGVPFLVRPEWADGAEWLFFFLLGILMILLLPRVGAAWTGAIGAVSIAAAFGVSYYQFLVESRLIDPVFPSLVLLLVYISSSLISYLRSESQRKHIQGAFGRYMSPALVAQLAKDKTKLELGGVTRDMTVMFSDIRGFTTISEQFDAAGLTQFINDYLTPMTNLILDHKGTIDKYMGDCIMAFWNAPLDDEQHAANACKTALSMNKRLLELNEQWALAAEKEGRRYIPIRAGIGLNSGDCCVGNMGSDLRQEYSVLGDHVNLASRLEGQSKAYGVDIVIGENTRARAPEYASVELDLIKVKGKTVPVRIFTLLGDEAMAASDAFKAFAQRHAEMIDAYRAQQWDKVVALIDDLRYMDFPLEKFYDMYLDRVAVIRKDPPGTDWDGVFTATSK